MVQMTAIQKSITVLKMPETYPRICGECKVTFIQDLSIRGTLACQCPDCNQAEANRHKDRLNGLSLIKVPFGVKGTARTPWQTNFNYKFKV